MNSRCFGFLLLFASCWPPLMLAAETPQAYDRVTLDATVSGKAKNDMLVAVLYYQSQGKNPAQVAERVNRVIAWGVAKAKQHPDIEVQTEGYRTSPVYQDGKLTGIWRVRHAVRLESRNFEKASTLLGELQEKLAIQYMGYQLSDEKRQEVERELMKRAIADFKERAGIIASQFGARDFRLVSVDISSTPGSPPMPMVRSMAAMESKMASPPVIEAGEQMVRVHINGTIELVRE